MELKVRLHQVIIIAMLTVIVVLAIGNFLFSVSQPKVLPTAYPLYTSDFNTTKTAIVSENLTLEAEIRLTEPSP